MTKREFVEQYVLARARAIPHLMPRDYSFEAVTSACETYDRIVAATTVTTYTPRRAPRKHK